MLHWWQYTILHYSMSASLLIVYNSALFIIGYGFQSLFVARKSLFFLSFLRAELYAAENFVTRVNRERFLKQYKVTFNFPMKFPRYSF